MDKAIEPPFAYREPLSAIVVGAYAWVVAMFWGMVLLDVAYANKLRDALAPSTALPVFSEIADFLLLIGSFIVVLGLGAVLLTWKSRGARISLLASLILLLLQFTAPALLAEMNPSDGQWIRIVSSTGISLLAFLGFYFYIRRR